MPVKIVAGNDVNVDAEYDRGDAENHFVGPRSILLHQIHVTQERVVGAEPGREFVSALQETDANRLSHEAVAFWRSEKIEGDGAKGAIAISFLRNSFELGEESVVADVDGGVDADDRFTCCRRG